VEETSVMMNCWALISISGAKATAREKLRTSGGAQEHTVLPFDVRIGGWGYRKESCLGEPWTGMTEYFKINLKGRPSESGERGGHSGEMAMRRIRLIGWHCLHVTASTPSCFVCFSLASSVSIDENDLDTDSDCHTLHWG
jgi:hypothetical protein